MDQCYLTGKERNRADCLWTGFPGRWETESWSRDGCTALSIWNTSEWALKQMSSCLNYILMNSVKTMVLGRGGGLVVKPMMIITKPWYNCAALLGVRITTLSPRSPGGRPTWWKHQLVPTLTPVFTRLMATFPLCKVEVITCPESGQTYKERNAEKGIAHSLRSPDISLYHCLSHIQ